MMPLSSKVSASASSSAGKLVLFERRGDGVADQRDERILKRGDGLPDGSRPCAHLEDRAGEEAPTRERAPHQVVEERVAQRDQLRATRFGGESGVDDLDLEDASGLVHGRELQLLLRPEVGVEPALAHVQRGREVADREPFESLDRRERHGLAHDRVAGAGSICTLLSLSSAR